jgi:hypothetical protein
MSRESTFAGRREREENRRPPKGFWHAPATKPGEKRQKERSERLPKAVAEAISSTVPGQPEPITTVWIREKTGNQVHAISRDMIIPKAFAVSPIEKREMQPLSKPAEELFDDYFKRLPFAHAINLGMTIELAGRKFLGLGKTSTYKIFNELDTYEYPVSLPVVQW